MKETGMSNLQLPLERPCNLFLSDGLLGLFMQNEIQAANSRK